MKVLVGLDLSEGTDKIIDTAQSLAVPLSAQVWLLHVAEPDPDFVGWDAGPETVREDMAKRFREEHRQIQALADKMRDAGLDVTALLVQGATVEKILSEAARLEADMIVLGSHGRGAVYQLVIGSMSEGVLRKADCPVLIVPTRESS